MSAPLLGGNSCCLDEGWLIFDGLATHSGASFEDSWLDSTFFSLGLVVSNCWCDLARVLVLDEILLG